jgi:toxin ParE1/3/4
MELNLYWTRFAEIKLEDIFEYYKLKAKSLTAEKLVSGIITKSLILKSNPKIGQIEELISLPDLEFRYLIYKNYKIIYFINHKYKQVEIVNIFDCRQNPEKIIDMV